MKKVDDILSRYDPAHPDFEVYREMREGCPVVHTGSSWLLTRYADVEQAARDDALFSSAGGAGRPAGLAGEDIEGELKAAPLIIPLWLDPPDFWTYRKLLTPLFTPGKARAMEPQIRDLVTELLDAVVETGRVDFVADLADPLPARLTCRLIGLPEDEWEYFATPAKQLVHERQTSGVAQDDVRSNMDWNALLPLVRDMVRIADERRADPRDDLLTSLVQAEVDGRPLTDYEIGSIALIMVIGGVDTTAGLIGSALVHLGRDAAMRERLVRDPALIPGATEEFLRAYSPVHMLPRQTTAACEFGDVTIPEGEMVQLGWAAANRDPAAFEDPDDVQIDRFPNRHMAFGVGIHRCLGSNIARLESRIALEEVLQRMPDFVLDEGRVRIQPHATIYGYAEVGARFTPGKRRREAEVGVASR